MLFQKVIHSQKSRLAIFLFTLSALILFPTAYATLEMAQGAAVLARDISRQFGVTEAKVVAVREDYVYINAGKRQFVCPGMIYEIVAETAPVNEGRSKLGMVETHVVDIKIAAVRDDLSIGQMIVEKPENTEPLKPAVGQKVVVKDPRLSIAVLPFDYLNAKEKETPRAIQELIIVELMKTGRFTVADRVRTEQVVERLKDLNIIIGDASFAREAAKLLGVSYLMYGVLTDVPGSLEVLCRVHEAWSGLGVAAASTTITMR